MSLTQRYLLRHYVWNSVWILPVFGMVAGLVTLIRSKGSEAHDGRIGNW